MKIQTPSLINLVRCQPSSRKRNLKKGDQVWVEIFDLSELEIHCVRIQKCRHRRRALDSIKRSAKIKSGRNSSAKQTKRIAHSFKKKILKFDPTSVPSKLHVNLASSRTSEWRTRRGRHSFVRWQDHRWGKEGYDDIVNTFTLA